MKDILIIGAGGIIGTTLVKQLLTEGKYNVTAVDISDTLTHQNLNKYKKRINIIYANILDHNIIEALIKNCDIVINLASCLPPFANYKRDLSDLIEFTGTENIIKAINYYNPNCHLIYGSSTSIYGNKYIQKENPVENDYFSMSKLKTEKLISKKVKKYTIVRLPLVIGNLHKNEIIYNTANIKINAITKEDASRAFVQIIENLNQYNKKEINLQGNDTFNIGTKQLFKLISQYQKINIKRFLSRTFGIKNYYSPIINDNSDANIEYQNDSLENYIKQQFKVKKKRSKK